MLYFYKQVIVSYMKLLHEDRPQSISILCYLLMFSTYRLISQVTNIVFETIKLYSGKPTYYEENSPFVIAGILLFSFIIMFISLVLIYGLWYLKRWGMYLYITTNLVAIVFSLITRNSLELVVQFMFLAYVLRHKNKFK